MFLRCYCSFILVFGRCFKNAWVLTINVILRFVLFQFPLLFMAAFSFTFPLLLFYNFYNHSFLFELSLLITIPINHSFYILSMPCITAAIYFPFYYFASFLFFVTITLLGFALGSLFSTMPLTLSFHTNHSFSLSQSQSESHKPAMEWLSITFHFIYIFSSFPVFII